MTNDEIDKEIAEFCGWKLEPLDGREFNGIPVMVWRDPDGERGFPIPCYSTDLNAMHEAEAHALRPTKEDNAMQKDEKWVKWDNYIEMLKNMVGRDDVAFATAAQRREAFLRTIGKWRGE